MHFYLWHWGDAGQWSWTRIVWHCILRRLRWQWSGGGGRGGDAGGDAGGGIDIGGESVASGRQAGTLRNGCIFGLLHAAECMPFECTLRIRNASALFSRELKSNDSIETAWMEITALCLSCILQVELKSLRTRLNILRTCDLCISTLPLHNFGTRRCLRSRMRIYSHF